LRGACPRRGVEQLLPTAAMRSHVARYDRQITKPVASLPAEPLTLVGLLNRVAGVMGADGGGAQA
jgi:hypothetical protein